ncbi:unnamed protein product [Psylliodes chrysocephalus]|uniref:Uncharacterized protein n=1 Tax=Psylliodes chrysocephalus TaxID=3402493 RepID=A0A9P0CX85_9CUCU|nr:unnamed protein product [Psylliodes chrysocephala]
MAQSVTRVTGLFLLFFICLIAAEDHAGLAEALAKFEKMDGFDECVKSSGVKKEDVLVFPPKDTNEVLCFFKCIMDKSGLLNSDGSVKMEEVGKYFKSQFGTDMSEKFLDTVKKCTDGTKIMECGDVKKVNDCIFASLKSP